MTANDGQTTSNRNDVDESITTAEESATIEDTAGTNEVAAHEYDEHVRDEGEVPDTTRGRRVDWGRVVVYGVMPALAFLVALTAGYFKWQESKVRIDDRSGVESVQAAKDSTIALLSYKPDDVEQKLDAARDLLTGEFRDSYIQLTQDVVIPGAKQKQISATATVPAASAVSATDDHAVALVFVNQTTVIGNGAPTASTSAVRVTMDKVNGRWLVSQFDPV